MASISGDAGLANAATVAAAVESIAQPASSTLEDREATARPLEMSQLDPSPPTVAGTSERQQQQQQRGSSTARNTPSNTSHPEAAASDPSAPARPPIETFTTASSSVPRATGEDAKTSLPTPSSSSSGAAAAITTSAAHTQSPPPNSPRPGGGSTTLDAVSNSRTRAESAAIGPSLDRNSLLPVHSASAIKASQSPASPAVLITLLLVTGARHPYKIDERYLRKRNVIKDDSKEGSIDPFAISVYTLKELIWKDWRDEWEPRPSSPSSIRLIMLGRMLDDKSDLQESRFSDAAPNVVHMTIKPQDIVDDEENAKLKKTGSRTSRGADEPSPGCRCCCVM